MPETMRQPNFAVLLGIAWLLTAGWLLLQFWSGTADSFSDPDDAMRLVEVRAYLAGRGWFDGNEPRIDPPFGYITHWSRLIDAGLAGLVVAFRVYVDPDMAERLTRAVWPLLWLAPAMAAVAAVAWRIAGREAALVALVLAVFGLPAFQQFKPGRIDHHNVQIALALVVVAAAVWSDRARNAAIAAGALSGLALAVGLESLPWVVLAGAAIAMRYVMAREGAGALAGYGLVVAAGAAGAFLVSVPPARWMLAACDAIAINTALPAVAGGLALGLSARWFAIEDRRLRATVVAVGGAAALAIFIAIEPRCIGGPFALIDAAARPLWLAQVREMEPLASFMRDAPVMGAWVSAFPVAALAVALLLAPAGRRDFGFLTASAALLIAAVMTVMAVKTYSYAMWFGMPLVAAGAVQLFARYRVAKPVRLLAATVMTPVAISAGAIGIAQAASPATSVVAEPARQACFKAANYAPVARLPAGLVVADVDYGPHLLAFTPHSVVAAPYHRLSHGIVAGHRALALPPAEARRLLAELRVDYIVLCGAARPTGLDASAVATGLWGRIAAGEVPDWLAPVAEAQGAAFVAYRVRR